MGGARQLAGMCHDIVLCHALFMMLQLANELYANSTHVAPRFKDCIARLPSLRTLSDRSRMARTCSIVEDALQFVVVWFLADRLPRAVADLLEICNDFERPTISDIFIVRDWEHGQSLTIIRGIF